MEGGKLQRLRWFPPSTKKFYGKKIFVRTSFPQFLVILHKLEAPSLCKTTAKQRREKKIEIFSKKVLTKRGESDIISRLRKRAIKRGDDH